MKKVMLRINVAKNMCSLKKTENNKSRRNVSKNWPAKRIRELYVTDAAQICDFFYCTFYFASEMQKTELLVWVFNPLMLYILNRYILQYFRASEFCEFYSNCYYYVISFASGNHSAKTHYNFSCKFHSKFGIDQLNIIILPTKYFFNISIKIINHKSHDLKYFKSKIVNVRYVKYA